MNTIDQFLTNSSKSNPEKLASRIRKGNRPVVSRIEDDTVIFDIRTVLPNDDDILATVISENTQE